VIECLSFDSFNPIVHHLHRLQDVFVCKAWDGLTWTGDVLSAEVLPYADINIGIICLVRRE
jgi:hypothetical protein